MKESTKDILVAWLQLELLGLCLFFVFFDWSDVLQMSCAVLDPKGEVYVDCDK